MARIGEQVKVREQRERREGTISQQVGLRPTVKEEGRRRVAIAKAKAEAERKQKELDESSVALSGVSLADYSTKYEEIPEWQKEYFPKPGEILAEEREKVSTVSSQVQQEIAYAQTKYEERTQYWENKMNEAWELYRKYQERKQWDKAKRYRERVDKYSERQYQDQVYWNTYSKNLQSLSQGMSVEKGYYSFSDIKSYASATASAKKKQKRQKARLEEQGLVQVGYTSTYVKPEELGLDPSKVGNRITTKDLEAEKIVFKGGEFYQTQVEKSPYFKIGDKEFVTLTSGVSVPVSEFKSSLSATKIASTSLIKSSSLMSEFKSSMVDTRTPWQKVKSGFEVVGDVSGLTGVGEKVETFGRGLFRSSIEAGISFVLTGLPTDSFKESEELTKMTGATYEQARSAERTMFKIVGTGISLGTGNVLAGGVISSVPEWKDTLDIGKDYGKELILTTQRKKDLDLKVEEVEKEWADYIGSNNQFIGTEKQFILYEKDWKEVEDYKKQLETQKITAKEFGEAFGESFETAALTAGAFYFGGQALKGLGGSKILSSSPKWLSSTLKTTGTIVERGAGHFFISEFSKTGADIAGTAISGHWDLAGVKTAELGGSVAGFMAGRHIAGVTMGKITDKIRIKSGERVLKLDTGKIKPFYKPAEGKYIYMERYSEPKLFSPSSWKNIPLKMKGYRPGQFTGRYWRLAAPEVIGRMKGKKQVSFWEIDPSTQRVYWVKKPTTPFPFAPISHHPSWFRKYGHQVYGLPGEKPVKWGAFGYSATKDAWVGTKFDIKKFSYPGGEMDLAAYQYYSGRGISLYFARSDGKAYLPKFSGSLSGFFEGAGTPTVYAGYPEKFRVSKAQKEVKGVQDGREMKAYLFPEGYPKYGEWVQPGLKMEPEAVTTFKERIPFGSGGFFKLFGRKVPIIKQTFSLENVPSTARSFVDTSMGGGVSSLPQPPRPVVYPFAGTSSLGGIRSLFTIPSVSASPSSRGEVAISGITSPSTTQQSSFVPSSGTPYSPSLSSIKSYTPTSSKIISSYRPTSYRPTSYRPTSDLHLIDLHLTDLHLTDLHLIDLHLISLDHINQAHIQSIPQSRLEEDGRE